MAGASKSNKSGSTNRTSKKSTSSDAGVGDSPQKALGDSGSPKPEAAASAAPSSSSHGLPPTVAAGLSALLPLVGGIVFVILEKENRMVRFHALQSIYFGGAMLLAGAVFTVLGILSALLSGIFAPLGLLFGFLVGASWFLLVIAFLVVYLIVVFKAFNGEEFNIPFLGQMVRKQLDAGAV